MYPLNDLDDYTCMMRRVYSFQPLLQTLIRSCIVHHPHERVRNNRSNVRHMPSELVARCLADSRMYSGKHR